MSIVLWVSLRFSITLLIASTIIIAFQCHLTTVSLARVSFATYNSTKWKKWSFFVSFIKLSKAYRTRDVFMRCGNRKSNMLEYMQFIVIIMRVHTHKTVFMHILWIKYSTFFLYWQRDAIFLWCQSYLLYNLYKKVVGTWYTPFMCVHCINCVLLSSATTTIPSIACYYIETTFFF